MVYYKKPLLNNIKSNIPPYIFSDFFWISSLLLNNGYPAQTVFNNLSTSKKNELHLSLTKIQKKINETGDPVQGLIKLPKLSRYHIEQLKQSNKNQSLAHTLKQIAKELQEETLQKIEQRINILKPLIIIVSGLYILALFYLMMVPMLKSMTNILE